MINMSFFQAVILGIVQGITEFLPVSSSGHLIAIPVIFGWEADGIGFDVMIHLATFLAVVFVFREDLMHMIRGLFGGKKDKIYARLFWMIGLATLPVVVVGLAFKDVVEDMLRVVPVVAGSLIVWGVVMGAADILTRIEAPRVKKVELVGWKRSVLVGLSQALALIPGTSRSGVTMSVGLLSGMDRATAARFSFLLSIPAVGGAALLVVISSISEGVSIFTPELLVGFIVSFLSGILAIKFLLKIIEKYSFLPFAIYRILLGILLLVFL